MENISQSIIMPFHRDKNMLMYTTGLLEKIIPEEVEIIVVGNNADKSELDVQLPPRFRFIKFYESMLYSNTVNTGVSFASGEIITLCDQDIYGYTDWYTPLLNKLVSNGRIGSVSSKLLNPVNNRIIDFGIEYSLYRIIHTFRGHLANHPLTLTDRKVTSTTSATFMTWKSLYNEISGMDLDMPYCCSDCDIGIKIRNKGYENWVVADSVAYHKGSTSNQNTKSKRYSFLQQDSHSMFWGKNYYHIKPTVTETICISLDHISKQHTLSPLYSFINLSTLFEHEWYGEQLEKLGNLSIADFHSYKTEQVHYSDIIQIYDYVPYSFMHICVPLIYFVDYFPSLQGNYIWREMRDTKQDIVMDSHGNIVMLDDIISGTC